MSKRVNGVLKIALRSDPGMVREHNEDAVFAEAGEGLAILADGMGGYKAGEVASAMAIVRLSFGVRALLRRFSPAGSQEDFSALIGRLLLEEVHKTNREILEASERQPQYYGMGTTLVMALFYDDRMTAVHLGDSRLYRLRGEALELLTHDHTLLQEQLDEGVITPAQARTSPQRGLLTRALGVDPEIVPEIHDHAVEPGDVYLLCSDGLHDMLVDTQIGNALRAATGDPDLAAARLVRLANDYGGGDNVSVIVIEVARPNGR